MNPAFWKYKKVFVTGHTGFKGSWLSLWLQSLGAEVTGYALEPPTKPSLFEVAHVAEGMTTLIGDVCDFAQLAAVISRCAPEIVIHMAAQSLVRYSYAEPVETFSTNVMGTVNVLEAVRQSGSVRVVIVVTSDKCYENREWVWGYREGEPVGGHDPYSSSKGCAELVTAAYRNSFFSNACSPSEVAVASVRAGNVIGGGDWAADRLVPDAMKAFMEMRPLVVRNPAAVRPWQFVLDPLDGYLTLAEKLWECGAEYAEAWNFGPRDDDAKPVAWMVDKFVELWGRDAKWTRGTNEPLHEAHHLRLDCSKARARLGWSPKLSLPMALEWAAEWYQSYLGGQNMHRLTKTQIERYQQLPRA